MKTASAALVILLLVAGCGNATDPETTAGSLPATTTASTAGTTTQVPATTTLVSGPSETAPGLLETKMTEDLVFHQGDERFDSSSGKVDVIAPTSGGPWPTVVVFHGAEETKTYHRKDAGMVAEQGRVVFLPNWMWIDRNWWTDAGTRAGWELMVQEATCALVYAKNHAAEYGGDPDHITVYGYSAGGNGALMASLAAAIPHEACVETGPAVTPQAIVAIDTDWLIAPALWDSDLSSDPEMFYSFTPYRHLDGSHDIPIHVMTTSEAKWAYRNVPADGSSSWLTYRHTDVDLLAELEELGILDDGSVDVLEFGVYGYHALANAGYASSLTVMPDSSHAHWSDEGRAALVETVLHAEHG